jgi:hypothetical protein
MRTVILGELNKATIEIIKKSQLINTADHTFGFSEEARLELTIAEYFNTKLTKLSRFHKFDFMTEDKVMIELKSRTFKHDRYPTTMVGLDKIKSLGPQQTAIFIFNFTDGLYYYEYNQNSILAFEIRLGGRTDRGCVEQKDYAYIPIVLLNKMVIQVGNPGSPTALPIPLTLSLS